MKKWTLVLWVGLVGCSSLFGGKRSEKAAGPEVRDVPYAARGEEEAPRHRVLVLPFLDERADALWRELPLQAKVECLGATRACNASTRQASTYG